MRYNRLYKDNHFLTPTTYTQTLSEYAEQLKYEDLPPEVVERAKMILLQTVGAALAAKGTPIADKACRMAEEANGGAGGGTTVWGTGKKLAAVNTALALGTMSDALDWEDCSWTGHPSAGVIPCAWLAAEEKHRSGKDLITAIVAGYEVYQRIACAVQPSNERWKTKGWGLTSWQIFGCILPVAKLYGLDARKINQAIGMGCECSTLPTAYHAATMSDFYHYEHGYRARDGFLIAKSVEKGIHNQRDALDEPRCYTGVICGNDGSNGSGDTTIRSEEADLTWLTRDLGSRYLTMETLLKHWPANMWVQTPVEIIRSLVREHGFGPEDVEEIVIDPPIRGRMWAPEEGFTSVTHAQFSAPYVIATMLYHPEPGAYWYAPEMMKDPEIIALARRVKAGPSPEDSPMTGFKQFRNGSYPMKTLTVRLKDGRELVGRMDCHPGHPKNMMTREEFVDRFRIQAAPVLQGERLEEVIKMLCSIECVDDVAAVSDMLA
ncbi:MAG: MmgE/PrpD family protein [Clostridiales bacterium]|nr:MmgE/PrpD family protein [Clostridiales bacterium]MDY4182502.1 MmgE/PrpD family protein [Pseudoflavonifractor sp.]